MNRFLQYACLISFLTPLLGAQQEIQYQPALPGYKYTFPRDHGSHPEFKLEWWYYTGNVRSTDGHEFGYELTFFRTGMDRSYENQSTWRVRDLYMAHFAVTDVTQKRFYYFDRINRAGPDIAGAEGDRLNVHNENWFALQEDGLLKIVADAGDAAIDLTLEPKKGPVIHGLDGVSQKADGAGHASHYYSMTRLVTSGKVRVGSKTLQVQGTSWMDHEFGTNQLTENQVGWDWFSIQTDSGSELMLYQMRNREGSLDPHSSGTLIPPKSQPQHLMLSDFVAIPVRFWKSTATGTSYPIEWTITLPGRGTTLRLTPLLDNQELVTTRSTGVAYWEGAVRVNGTWEGKPIAGRGYIELTGYSERYRPRV